MIKHSPQPSKARIVKDLQRYHANVMPMAALRTDNDQTYKSEGVKDWCASMNVRLTNSAPYS